MATYTMPLHVLVDGYTQSDIGLNTRQRIEKARSKIFDFEYPFFDEGLRAEFETHFIRNFYTREIGFETEGLFKFQLETWLQINMPFFNKLLESETLSFNPLQNVDVKITSNLKNEKDQNDTIDRTQNETATETGTHDKDTTGSQTLHTDQVTSTEQNSTSNTTDHAEATIGTTEEKTGNDNKTATNTENNFDRNIKSDTPQNRLELTTNDGSGVIEYASSLEENKEKNTQTNEEETTSTQNATTNTNQNSDATSENTVNQTGNENVDVDTTIQTTETVDEGHTKNNTNNLTGNQTLDSAVKVLEDYAKQEVGKTGSMTYSKMLAEYRSTFLRIERDIFNEMNELFMLVY